MCGDFRNVKVPNFTLTADFKIPKKIKTGYSVLIYFTILFKNEKTFSSPGLENASVGPGRSFIERKGAVSQKEALKSINVYVNEENKATICCPYCGYTATVSAEKFSTDKKILKTRCTCGKGFLCSLEFRKHYRKTVRLAGSMRNLRTRKVTDIVVRDISGGGIGFTILSQNTPEIGDVLDLDFTLDNANRSKISVQVSVRTVKERFVGSQFAIRNLPRELGFYLMK